MKARESVVVQRVPFGSTAFCLSRADLGEDGTLTIVTLETGRVWETFPAGTWREAYGVGQGGLELYRFIPGSAATRFSQEVA